MTMRGSGQYDHPGSGTGEDATRIEAEFKGNQASHDPFVSAVRATRMPMVVTNPRLPDNPIVFVNDSFCRLTGYAREEILGRNCRFLQGPETRPEDVAAIRAAIKKERSIEVDIRNHRRDGTPFWNRLLLAPVRDEAGALTYFFASQLDVSLERDQLAGLEAANSVLSAERALAEERLALNEVTLKLSVDAAEIGTWDLDLTTNVLTWPLRTKAMFGISPDVPCSMDDFYAGLHPDDREDTGRAFASALDPDLRATYDVEYRTIGKEDGIVRWVAAKGRGIFDDTGRCVRAIGTAIDISRRKATEDRLRASEAGLRELNDRLEQRVEERSQKLRDSEEFARLALSAIGGVGVWTYDLAADCFFCDENIAKLYDIDPVQGAKGIMRADFLANVHEDDRADLRATMAGGAIEPGDLELEYRIVHRDGSVHWVLSRGHTHFNEAGQAVRRTGVGVDMTKQRLVEDQLRQSQKMEAVGQLTGGIAHDFNNLLQGITGSLEIIQRRISQDKTTDLDRLISGATAAANRAAALTHRLLAFSRRQPLDPKPVRANTLVASMEDLLRRTIGEIITFKMALTNDLWTTRCDPNQLESAVLNLAINARDAMPDGGRLTIETGNAHLDEAYAAQQRGVKPGQYVCISVTDTGTGMSADTIAKAFEPFFTTKPIGQGTGLGLSMIYGFVQQSEGHVKIYSEVGHGTSFKVYLPRFSGASEEEQVPRLAELPATDAGEIILVVEDEAVVRDLIVEELREFGYVALEAVDGPKGLEILKSEQRIDMLVTDVGLPGLNGRQVADAAKALRPDIRVLFMTGYAENAALASGFLEPSMEMITKPFAIEALMEKIRGMFGE